MEIQKRFRVIIVFFVISIAGFIGLGAVLNHQINGAIGPLKDLPFEIILSSLFVLIACELYLVILVMAAVIGYAISRFRESREYALAFKYLSLIYLAILIVFTLFLII